MHIIKLMAKVIKTVAQNFGLLGAMAWVLAGWKQCGISENTMDSY